jgi:outer membrane protease
VKNITVFLFLVSIAYLPAAAQGVESAVPANKESGSWAITIAPRFGMLYGQAEEIVYPTITKGEKLSQLLWDMKPLFYYGLLLELSPEKPLKRWGFFSLLSLKTGIPGITGVMEDRDWDSVQNDALTHYSIHDNETREMLWVDFSAGLSFPLPPFIVLKAFAGVSYKRFAFSGWDGSGTYAREVSLDSQTYYPITDSPMKWDFDGKVINYAQDWLIVTPGVSITCYFLSDFSLELAFQISPLIWCSDLDEHLTRKLQYRDYTRDGLFLEPSGTLSFAATRRLTLSFEFSYTGISGSKGQIYLRSYGEGNYLPAASMAGTGLSIMDMGLMLKIRL